MVTSQQLTQVIAELIGFGAECGSSLTFHEFYQVSPIEIRCMVSEGDNNPNVLYVQCFSTDPKALNNSDKISIGYEFENPPEKTAALAKEFDYFDGKLWAIKVNRDHKYFTMYSNDDGCYSPTLSAHISRIPDVIKLLQQVK